MAQTLKGAGSGGVAPLEVGQMLAATAGVKGAKSARERELIAARGARARRPSSGGTGAASAPSISPAVGLMRAENFDSDGEEDDYDTPRMAE